MTVELIHDLKTPLQLICSCAQMARRELADREPCARRYVDMLMQNVQEMQRMLVNVMDCERLQSGAVRLAPICGDLAACVREICARFQVMAADAGIRLSCRCGCERVRMRFDEEKVFRILLNLLSNAIRFTPIGGEICVELADEGNWAAVAVSDTGCGIAEDMLESVFEKGVTDGGTGLGLYIARSYAQLHGGTLSACQRPEGGSRFLLRIPKDA